METHRRCACGRRRNHPFVNLGGATGHPSFGRSASFSNQVIAQSEPHQRPDSDEKSVCTLRQHLAATVARLFLDKLGIRITPLGAEQAAGIGVPVNGPYQPQHYRY